MLFDLVVLGREPAGLEAAIQAAELGQRVAVAEDPVHFGAVGPLGIAGPLASCVQHFSGFVRFATAHSLEIVNSQKTVQINARRFVLACGDRPKRPPHVPFDGLRILDSDDARACELVPKSWLIVGAGRHGLECARHLLAGGLRVSLVDQSSSVPETQVGPTSRPAWTAIRKSRCPVHWGTTVLGVERRNSLVTVYHDNGSIESYEGVVFAVGRVGCTGHLNLPRPDLLLDESQRVWCNDVGQTGIPHIYAVGSVVGFPRSIDPPTRQAARVIAHAFQAEIPSPNFAERRTPDLLMSRG